MGLLFSLMFFFCIFVCETCVFKSSVVLLSVSVCVCLHLPYHNISNVNRVQIVTWNVGSAVPPDDITSLFGSNLSSRNVDMFVVG